MYLCGNSLPWVKSGKHVGQNIDDKADGLKHDILVKRAQFIEKNNTLRQEFSFAHPYTLLQLNQAYNSDFTGSCVWDLFCREQEMLENSYNKAVRLMLGLPLNSHRYFIEPLSGKKHLKSELIKRFLTFVDRIQKSSKTTLSYVLELVSQDVRSVTGKNQLAIKQRCGKEIRDRITANESFVAYKEVPPNEAWRISVKKELIECTHETLFVDGFEKEELQEMMTWITTTGPS